jgi:hypothetical protein
MMRWLRKSRGLLYTGPDDPGRTVKKISVVLMGSSPYLFSFLNDQGADIQNANWSSSKIISFGEAHNPLSTLFRVNNIPGMKAFIFCSDVLNFFITRIG